LWVWVPLINPSWVEKHASHVVKTAGSLFPESLKGSHTSCELGTPRAFDERFNYFSICKYAKVLSTQVLAVIIITTPATMELELLSLLSVAIFRNRLKNQQQAICYMKRDLSG